MVEAVEAIDRFRGRLSRSTDRIHVKTKELCDKIVANGRRGRHFVPPAHGGPPLDTSIGSIVEHKPRSASALRVLRQRRARQAEELAVEEERDRRW